MEKIFKQNLVKLFIFILTCFCISYSLSKNIVLNKCRQTVRKITGMSVIAQTEIERPSSVPLYLSEVPSFNIPRSNQESEFYRAKGYDESSYKGIDEIIYYGLLGAKLKEAGVDPEHTHIEDLIRLVYVQINWFKEVLVALKMYNDEPMVTGVFREFYLLRQEKRTRYLDNIFDDVIKEAQEKVHKRKVTYRWFTIWNHRLTMLASIFESDNVLRKIDQWKTHQDFEKLSQSRTSLFRDSKNYLLDRVGLKDLKYTLDNFPNEIVFYIPGEIGIIALNYTEPTGVPIGFMNDSPLDFYGGKRKPTDGTVLSSVVHSAHDLRHHRDGFGKILWSRNINSPISKAEFKRLFVDKVRQMPQEQGYQAHVGFFLLNHEFSNKGEMTLHIHNREDILRMILSKLNSFNEGASFASLLPSSIVENFKRINVENYLRETARIFSDVIDQIVEEATENGTEDSV